ncbi:MAG: murein biosynthesis integral membrane protein MurJ [Planctomycetes bacterium]|nr:murein biosynthesis integral membrane protein MurJ [Planctomycetota bacterium]
MEESGIRDRSAEGRRGFLGAFARLSAITAASRVLGLFREIAKAHFLGTRHPAADAFTVGFMIPNLLRRLIGEGAMSAAFIPVLADYQVHGDPRAMRDFVARVLHLLLVVLTILVALGILLAPWYVPYGIAAGYGEEKADLTTLYTRIMFPFIGLVSLSALVQGVLNCHGRFSIPAMGPVVLNIFVIAAAWLFADREDPAAAGRLFAWAVVGGGLLQLAIQIPTLVRLGYPLRPRSGFRHPGVRRVVALFLPLTVGAGLYQVNVAASTVIATWLRMEGANAALRFSSLLLELTMGIFVVSVATAVLPQLSRMWTSGDREGFVERAGFATRLVILIALPASCGLILLRREIVDALFRTGAFDRESVRITAFALLFHAPSLLPASLVRLFSPVFYAAKDVRTPVKIAAVVLAANVILCLALAKPLAQGGIALAGSLSTGIAAILFLWGIRAKLERRGLPGVAGTAWKIAVACALMVAAHYLVVDRILPWDPGARHAARILVLLAKVALETLVYAAAVLALRVGDLTELVAILRRRRRAA